MSDDVLRADHRFMKEVITSSFSGEGLAPLPEELDLVARVFAKAGGTWSGVFLGSVRDVTLLKKVMKIAVKRGLLTKSPKWSGS